MALAKFDVSVCNHATYAFALNRHDAIKCAASQAVIITRRVIEKGFAAPTAQQAQVVGIESVVEGVRWDLSMEQLQVRLLCQSDCRTCLGLVVVRLLLLIILLQPYLARLGEMSSNGVHFELHLFFCSFCFGHQVGFSPTYLLRRIDGCWTIRSLAAYFRCRSSQLDGT